MKTGLILEGGAMRGLFTAGVMDVLLENDITFDGAIGVSAGACFGCNYKSRQIGRVIRYNKRFAKDKRYCSFESLLKTGDLYGKEFCYYTLPEKLDLMDDEAYRANPMKFYVVVTNAETGKAEYVELKNMDHADVEYMRASASMPVVSRPVQIGEYHYLDGGIADSIPVKAFQEMGYERNVVILTRSEAYRKKPMKGLAIMRAALRKYPNVVKDLEERDVVYNATLGYLLKQEQEGTVFIIRPDKEVEAGKIEHDPEVMQRVYEQGRREGEKQVEAVKKFLAEAKKDG